MRSHASPVFISADRKVIRPLERVAIAGDANLAEVDIQNLIQEFPSCLPISELDPLFRDPIPICTELNTKSGPIDNLFITPSGLPILVECKLWANPESRRKVIGQIIDYATQLSRWSIADLQREVSKRVGRVGNVVLEEVRRRGFEVDEAEFNDAVAFNLRRGRFLLIIVGEGIRADLESMVEFLQAQAGLQFSIGLVELPIFRDLEGNLLLTPRVVVKSDLVVRNVVAMPDGYGLSEEEVPGPISLDNDPVTAERVAFWTDMLSHLELDDPNQPIPKVSRQGYVYFGMPGGAWLTVYRDRNQNVVGIYLSYTRNSLGETTILRVIEDEGQSVLEELGYGSEIAVDKLNRKLVSDHHDVASLLDDPGRSQAITWLRSRVNDFVNCLRPRLTAVLEEIR